MTWLMYFSAMLGSICDVIKITMIAKKHNSDKQKISPISFCSKFIITVSNIRILFKFLIKKYVDSLVREKIHGIVLYLWSVTKCVDLKSIFLKICFIIKVKLILAFLHLL